MSTRWLGLAVVLRGFASGVSGVCKHKVLAGYPKVLKVAV